MRRRLALSVIRTASPRSRGGVSADYGVSDAPDWRSVEWRRHMRAMTLEGRRVHVIDIGTGTAVPVVFVHGLGGRWQNWLENIACVASERRVIALDLPGFGNSQAPSAAISIPGYARTIEGVCDRLELDTVALVGSSMGGLIAAETALRHRERVAALALVSAACVSVKQIDPAPATQLLAALARSPLATPSGIRALIARPRTREVIFGGVLRHPSRISPEMLCELAAGTGASGVRAALAALTSHDVRDVLHELELPTLILHGRDDLVVPVADSERLGRLVSGSEVVVFEDTGHLPMLERPRRFNDQLLRFLERATPSAVAPLNAQPEAESPDRLDRVP